MAFTRLGALVGVGIAVFITSSAYSQNTFSVVTTFEDSECSGVPSKLTFWRDAECQVPTKAVCEPVGNSLFSVSNCTEDFAGFASEAFGDANPYAIDRFYSSEGCGSVGFVHVYSTDGVCHVNPDPSTGFSSFRSWISQTDGSLAFAWFRDTVCSNDNWYHGGGPSKDMLMSAYCLREGCEVMPGLCSREKCGSPPYGLCSRMFSVGGLGGTPTIESHTIVVVYNDSSCSSPAVSVSLTSELDCTPQIDRYNPMCVEDGEAYTVSDCTQYNAGGWDDVGVISDAFGGYPHLVVESYVWCGIADTVTDVVVYRLDEECHPNAAGTESHKLALGRSVNITTYSDTNCVDVATQRTVRRSTILAGNCGSGDKKVIVNNVQSAFTFRAVYEDSSCSGTPSQLIFMRTIWCDPVQNENQSCESIGDSLFLLSGCTHDYAVFAPTAFGADTQFVIEELFFLSECNNAEIVFVYLADGLCHTDLGDSSSFLATIDADNTLVLKFFYQQGCQYPKDIARSTKDQLIPPMCKPYDNKDKLCTVVDDCYNWWRVGRKIYIGGQGGIPSVGKETIVAVYDDNSCSPDGDVFKWMVWKQRCDYRCENLQIRRQLLSRR